MFTYKNVFILCDLPEWPQNTWFSQEPPTVTDSATKKKKKICSDSQISLFSKVFLSLLEDSVIWEGRRKWQK